jgi:hypothetical protein
MADPSAPPATHRFVLRLARRADTAAVDALRIAAYQAAPWMPGVAADALRCRHDGRATRVMTAWMQGQLVATSAVVLAPDGAALRDELDAPAFDPGAVRWPVLVSKRTAVAPGLQGRGVVALFRHHYLHAACDLGAGAVCSGHVAATPNVRGLVRLGYAVHDMGERTLAGLGSTETVRTLVCCLPAARLANALAALRAAEPDIEARHRWWGESLPDALRRGNGRRGQR